MLYKSLSSMINGSLLKRNKCIVNGARHSMLSRNAHVDSEEPESTDTKKLNNKIKEVKLNAKAKTRMESKSTSENEKNEFVKYLAINLNPKIINMCPNIMEYMKMSDHDRNLLCLIDSHEAAEFVSIIIDDFTRDIGFVAELNPGIGVLTTELLNAGIPLIHLYEYRKEFDSVLENLSNIYPGRLNQRRFNLLEINTLKYLDKITNRNEMVKIFQGVESKRWEDRCMQVIGAVNTVEFMKHVVFSLLFRNSFMTYGRTVFYIAIPPTIWHKYTCDNRGSSKLLFQLMFDYKLLGKLKRKAFLPWKKRKKKKKSSQKMEILDEMDCNEMFVVKFEPKIDMYSTLSQENWIKFWYFLAYTVHRRNNKVIPEIEKWVPGSGIRIIGQCNYTIFTEFGDLTPEEFLKLFKEFQSWPEYKTSSFLSSMKDVLSTFDEPAILELSVKDDNDMHDMHD